MGQKSKNDLKSKFEIYTVSGHAGYLQGAFLMFLSVFGPISNDQNVFGCDFGQWFWPKSINFENFSASTVIFVEIFAIARLCGGSDGFVLSLGCHFCRNKSKKVEAF